MSLLNTFIVARLQLKKSCQNYAMQLSADYESPLTNYPQTFRRGSECFADCKNEA